MQLNFKNLIIEVTKILMQSITGYVATYNAITHAQRDATPDDVPYNKTGKQGNPGPSRKIGENYTQERSRNDLQKKNLGLWGAAVLGTALLLLNLLKSNANAKAFADAKVENWAQFTQFQDNLNKLKNTLDASVEAQVTTKAENQAQFQQFQDYVNDLQNNYMVRYSGS